MEMKNERDVYWKICKVDEDGFIEKYVTRESVNVGGYGIYLSQDKMDFEVSKAIRFLERGEALAFKKALGDKNLRVVKHISSLLF